LLGVAVLGAVVAHFEPAFTASTRAAAADGFAAAAFVAAGIAVLAFGGTAVLMAPRGASASLETLVQAGRA
jgi:hypothetical protein